MVDTDLTDRIRLGEDSSLEFKSVHVEGGRIESPDRRDLADELAALANGRGGTVLLGVRDKTRVVQGIPLDHLDTVELWVREICNDSIKPPLDADIVKLELEGANGRLVPIIRIDVERSIYVHKSPRGYFRRIGSSNREMPPDALARPFQERSQTRVIRFDESVVPGTARPDLDYALTLRFLRGDIANETIGATPEETSKADDVRSAPYSRFNPHFNRDALARALKPRGIHYVFLGRELGVRSNDPSCYKDGRISHERVAETNCFRNGIKRLVGGAGQQRIAIMCAEREPLDCHRTLPVASALDKRNVHVSHILEDGELESHALAMDRLSTRHRLDPDGDLLTSREDAMATAIERQARLVGFVNVEPQAKSESNL